MTAKGNRIWSAVEVVNGVGNLHSQICCSFSCHTFLPLLPLVSYHKVNWAGPIFDPNYIPMQLGCTGQPNPLSTHIYHISPPQPHDPSFQNSNMLPHPQPAWPSPIFPFQGPACLLCPLSCLSTKELKTTPNHDTSHQCTSRGRGRGRGLMFLGACSIPTVPSGMHRLWAVSPGHSVQPGEDCSGLQLPFQHLHGTPSAVRGETGVWLTAAAHFHGESTSATFGNINEHFGNHQQLLNEAYSGSSSISQVKEIKSI